MEEYVPAYCKSRTRVEYRHAVERYILPVLGPIKVTALACDDVVALHHDVRDKPYQANWTFGVVLKMMNLAGGLGPAVGPLQSLLPCPQVLGEEAGAVPDRQGVCALG